MKELYLLLLCMVTTSLGKNKSVDLELDYETGEHLCLSWILIYINPFICRQKIYKLSTLLSARGYAPGGL